eukprot:m.552860 g.552860  ORF g.552860 m.552860 type:complete len:774 (+) comp22168_c0_seq14:39-2360(+)
MFGGMSPRAVPNIYSSVNTHDQIDTAVFWTNCTTSLDSVLGHNLFRSLSSERSNMMCFRLDGLNRRFGWVLSAVLLLALCISGVSPLAFPTSNDAQVVSSQMHDFPKRESNQRTDEDPKSFLKSLAGKIKHVIVLMEENRSFDHFFGFAKKLLGVNGLTGTEYNQINVSDPWQGRVTVDNKSPYCGRCDPNHGTPATAEKVANKMGGFISYENERGHAFLDWCGVMNMFTPERIPVITQLAQEFALMDEFFCSHPGPTWPNRMFGLSATSAGSTSTGTWYQNKTGKLFPQKMFFDQVNENKMTWRNYYNDTPWEMFMEGIAHNPANLQNMETFFSDAAKGTLPNYAWINPRSGINVTTGLGSNDQHPDHDVALGERLMKDVYEALRASPQWNETLLIITMDEHGGFYDHVVPPSAPNPGDEDSMKKSYPDAGYNFSSLGVRIPTLLISPWIPKGTVVSAPPVAQKPTPTSKYDLTSIMATTRKLLGMPSTPLTKRDAWAATFEHVFSLEKPRTDCPAHLVDAPPPTLDGTIEAALPLNELQRDIVHVHAHLAGMSDRELWHSGVLSKQGRVSAWVQSHVEAHKARTQAWVDARVTPTFRVVCQPPRLPDTVEDGWSPNTPSVLVQKSMHGEHAEAITISTVHLNVSETPFCLGVAGSHARSNPVHIVPGAHATVLPCYPSVDPSLNIDPLQHWVMYGSDATIRPAHNTSLCLTAIDTLRRVVMPVTVETCDTRVQQRWAYHGVAPGDSGGGQIMYGDDANYLSVIRSEHPPSH